MSINWHTKSQGPKKKCTHFSRGRIHSCPAGTARNQGSFTSMALWSVQSFLSSTVYEYAFITNIFCYRTSNPKPLRWPKILVISRMYWKNLPMEYYDFRSKSWNTLCDVNNWRSCTSMVSHGTCIFFLGGK